ncbi:hypothetical protein SAMN05444277_110133 [Parafilimonas terrae]|uniref:Uncharacterized protein n=1 Tax=Parafilimonas terrae TaxID=1465490 RepID=A0A1I5Y389_9BACT|nr:hypothetical protein SAMN05444277_110133 [Parafilimonas terrae]
MQITDYLPLLNANSNQEFNTGESLEKQVRN